MENGIGYKEYPSAIMTVQEWAADLPNDGGEEQSCRDYYLSQVKRVSPNTQKNKRDWNTSKKGITEMELILI
jgi:hypothetical protein